MYSSVDAGRLVSPSNALNSCVEQGTGLDCAYSFATFGAPAFASAGLQQVSAEWCISLNTDPSGPFR